MQKESLINVSECRVLMTIDYLNKQGYYPLPEGINKILSGEVDEETRPFIGCPTFQTIVSYPNRRVVALTKSLIKNGLVRRIYDKENDDYYLLITPKGEEVLTNYLKHHSVNLDKHTAKKKKTIIKAKHL